VQRRYLMCEGGSPWCSTGCPQLPYDQPLRFAGASLSGLSAHLGALWVSTSVCFIPGEFPSGRCLLAASVPYVALHLSCGLLASLSNKALLASCSIHIRSQGMGRDENEGLA